MLAANILSGIGPDCEVKNRCIKRLNDVLDERISGNEFDIEDAYDFLDEANFKEMIPMPEPVESQAYLDWVHMPEDQKKKVMADKNASYRNTDMWHEMMEYLKKASEVKNKNKSTVYWLNWVKNTIPAEDIPAHQKINERLRLFERGERKVTRWSQRTQVYEENEPKL